MEPKREEPARGISCEVQLISECGPVREENQDAGLAWRGDRGELALIVSDGMGGHAAGREAAEIVVRFCLEAIRARDSADWRQTFQKAIAAAHSAVLEAAGQAGGHGMGATAALAVIDDCSRSPRLYLAHVGDSRVYLYRGRSLYRLTADHSLVAQMVREGWLREEEAFGHPDSNVIQRAIGQAGALEPEVQEPVELDAGDVVLVCSDGLHGAVPDAVICEVLGRSGSADEICQSLLGTALAAASQDNITIGCARVSSGQRRRIPTRVYPEKAPEKASEKAQRKGWPQGQGGAT